MPQFRFKADGHFMGKYFKKDDVVELHEKQAKYALLSGQLEWVNEPPKAMKPKKKSADVPFAPVGVVAPEPKKKPDEKGEYSIGRKVGSTYRGALKR